MPVKVSTIPTQVVCVGSKPLHARVSVEEDGDVWVDAAVNLLLSSIDFSTKVNLV